MPTRSPRDQFETALADLLDKTASADLVELVANHDSLRDDLHAARQIVALVKHAADDYVPTSSNGGDSQQGVGTNGGEQLHTNTPAHSEQKDATHPLQALAPTQPLAEPSDHKGEPLAIAPGGRIRGPVAVWMTIAAIALLGAVIYWAGPSGRRTEPTATRGAPINATMTQLNDLAGDGRAEVCTEPVVNCRPARQNQRLEPGTLVRTNARARASLKLDDGSAIVLDRGTVLGIAKAQARGALRLDTGNVVIDVVEGGVGALVVDLGIGFAELNHAKCSITRDEQGACIEVIRGNVQVEGASGRTRMVSAGETARLEPKVEPTVAATQSAGTAFVAAESIEDKSTEEGERSRGLGELRAKKPGESQERNDAVRLSRHHARVRIVGPVARTEIDEVFTNATDEVLEGIFRFPLPAGAQIERLALEVDGKLVEGAFTDRERAGAIWRGSIVHAQPQLRSQIKDEIIWVEGPWRDPALLEWQRGNRFELRIYPIPKRGSRRVVLAYTELVPGTLGTRRYSYPLPQQESSHGSIDDFSLDLQLRGHEPKRTPRVAGYAGHLRNDAREVADFTLSERHFVPQGDLVLSYELASGSRELTAWAYSATNASEDSYVALLLRPSLSADQEASTRTYAFTVDTSRSMVGENLRRAVAVTTRMIRELSSDASVVVLACDSSCRTWPHGRVAAGQSAAQRAEHWLKEQTAEGASDLVATFEAAIESTRSPNDALRHIVYVGDGTPTVGPTRSATITQAARNAAGGSAVGLTAVAIGAESDLESLRALARATDGLVIPYVPGTSVTQMSYAALTATFAPRLADAHLELPSGLRTVAPERIDAIVKGGELLVVGRTDAAPIRGDVVLRGTLKGRPFEQRFSLDVQPIAGEANAFVPRLFAGLRVGELERRGDALAKAEAIELSRRFSVASRYTSLLVLESQAMFDAFALDNRRHAATWTGELEDRSSSSGADTESNEEASNDGDDTNADGSTTGPSTSGRLPAQKSSPSAGTLNLGAGRESAVTATQLAKKESAAAPAPAAAAAEPKRPAIAPLNDAFRPPGGPLTGVQEPWEPLLPTPRPRRRVMIPMRRIWERKGEVYPDRLTVSSVNDVQILAAERAVAESPNQRNATQALFDLYARRGNVDRASEIAERWSLRDPLDVEALIARADIAARRGQRALAIRILGSVVDVRPSDVGAQQRLARLFLWQGDAKLACRFSFALAEFRPADARALVDALRCLRDSGADDLAATLRASASEKAIREVGPLLERAPATAHLSGDLRVTATWQGEGDVDVDLSMIDPDGHRISWLGAPTRAVITALNVTNSHEEGLGLRGGKPGEYLLEVTRGRGVGRVHGTANVRVAGVERPIRFILDGDRALLGVAKIAIVPRLVPLPPPIGIPMAE